MQDLKQAFPELAKGLQQLLDYRGEDVEGTFVLHFEVEYEYFGEMRTHELRPGGSKVRVPSVEGGSVMPGQYHGWAVGYCVECASVCSHVLGAGWEEGGDMHPCVQHREAEAGPDCCTSEGG